MMNKSKREESEGKVIPLMDHPQHKTVKYKVKTQIR